MKATLLTVVIAILLTPILMLNASTESEQLNGTWSGSWSPNVGVYDAMTIELRYENGKLTGRFVTPSPMNFSKATFDTKTRALTVEASDGTGKSYKLNAKVDGTEIKGTVVVGEQTGMVDLIKWTFVPPIR